MWVVLVPVLLFLGLASHDDVTRFWWDHPRPGCHWLYRQHGAFAWPLKQTNAVLCWQESEIAP